MIQLGNNDPECTSKSQKNTYLEESNQHTFREAAQCLRLFRVGLHDFKHHLMSNFSANRVR